MLARDLKFVWINGFENWSDMQIEVALEFYRDCNDCIHVETIETIDYGDY